MQINNVTRLPQGKRVFFEETSTYDVALKKVKCKKNIAVVNCVFAQEGKESMDKILEKLIKAVDLTN